MAEAERPSRRPFYGWAIVVLGGIVAFNSAPGQSFVFSVFIDDLIEDTGLSRTSISLLYAIGTGVSAFMVFTVSRLADRYGARTTLIAAATGLGLACFAMSQAREALIVSAVMVGITGSALGPLPLAWLASKLGGFEPAVLIMAVLPVLAIGAVAIARPPTEVAAETEALSPAPAG